MDYTANAPGYFIYSDIRCTGREDDLNNRCILFTLFDLWQFQDVFTNNTYAGAHINLKCEGFDRNGHNGDWTCFAWCSFDTTWNTASNWATLSSISYDDLGYGLNIFDPDDLGINEILIWDVSDAVKTRIVDGTTSSNGKITIVIERLNDTANGKSSVTYPVLSWDAGGGSKEVDEITFHDYDGTLPFTLAIHYWPTAQQPGIGPGFG